MYSGGHHGDRTFSHFFLLQDADGAPVFYTHRDGTTVEGRGGQLRDFVPVAGKMHASLIVPTPSAEVVLVQEMTSQIETFIGRSLKQKKPSVR